MKYSKKHILFIFILFSSLAIADNHSLKDQEIADAIEDEYLYDHAINVNKIDVDVTRGVAELTGTVDNILAKDRATKIARLVKGVKTVSNRIEVTPPKKYTDEFIKSSVVNALMRDPATNSYELTAKVNNGKVTLTGEVNSYQGSNLSAQVAKSVKGVIEVENNIDINYKKNRNDSEIKNEVRELLKWSTQVDDGLIAVSVNNGKVILTGVVGSAFERKTTEWISWVAGVKSVDASGLDVRWWAKDTDLRKNKPIDIKDEEISQAIRGAAIYDPRVYSFNISPEVDNGKVTLRGSVSNLKAKKAAENLAKNTIGVINVDNRLKVKGEWSNILPEIESNIEKALVENSITEAYEIDVRYKNGVVTLNGLVDSYVEKNEAEWIASGIAGVTEINNQLKINYPYGYYWHDIYPYHTRYYKPPSIIESATINYPNDQQIQSNVKDELWWSPFVTADQVNIKVKDGEVTLSGTVDSWREYNAAVENAWEGGAWAINNLLIVD